MALKLDSVIGRLLGAELYPKTLKKAFNILINYCAPKKSQIRGQPSHEGVVFLQHVQQSVAGDMGVEPAN